MLTSKLASVAGFQPTPGPTETVGGTIATADATDRSGSRLVQTWRRDEQGRLRGEWLLIRWPALDTQQRLAA
jgi:hypothetical protein